MSKILDRLKKRRKELGLTQQQMMLRVGMSRQQYQRLESRGNPRLDNLELIAKGLKMQLMLIPQEKLQAVRAVLESGESVHNDDSQAESSLADDPWKDLLAGDE